jgi:DNA-binding response OmpR family regulator
MKVLLVEDEPKVSAFIKKGLEELENQVEVAADGFTGNKMATENQYDVIVMDVMLPFINGVNVTQDLRSKGIQTPILMLTALGSTDDKLNGFDAGADDYLIKPFEFKELVARLKALARRKADGPNDSKVLRVADLEMNTDQKKVTRSGKKIDLTAKEFALLEYFLRNKDRVISRSEIADKVWDIHFDTGTNVIDVYVNFLRKKVDKDFTPKLLHTMVGMGYVLRIDD